MVKSTIITTHEKIMHYHLKIVITDIFVIIFTPIIFNSVITTTIITTIITFVAIISNIAMNVIND